MTTSNPGAADESWVFALALYARPGVAEACLALQAEADVDVMLMLVVLHAVSQRRIALTAADIETMNASCRLWREQIVRPLRAVRTILKSGPAPAPSAATETLRSQIKAIELASERLENNFLVANLPSANLPQQTVTRHHIKDAIIRLIGCNPHLTDAQMVGLLPAVTTLVQSTEHFVREQN